MSSNIILADNGVSSGTAGIKESGGSDGTLLLQTTTSGGTATTAITIDNLQNVGVGVTPSAWSNFKAIQMTNGVGLASYTAGAVIMNLGANQYYNGSNYVYVNSDYSTSYQQTAGVHKWWVAPSGTAGATITETQAMTLDNNGRFLVNKTSATTYGSIYAQAYTSVTSGQQWLSVFDSAVSSAPQGLFITYTNSAPNGLGNEFIYARDTGALRFAVESNGGIQNFSANNTNLSDATMKKDITPAKNYLSILNQIPVVTFLFNDQTDTETNLGVTAQSVQAVAPELVGTMDVGTKETPNVKLAIYETDLKYAMLKAIQELSAKVTTLEAKVGA